MIEASFDDRSHKSTAIGGIYQYDTGQRLKMHGLPSPEELAERDDFLSGDTVTVQAQYGFVGDSQTETRIASYDEESACWMADIPDSYLTKSGTVKVFVYVGYGAADGVGRSKTCYEGSFTPISRPAPSTQVTPSQSSAWDALVAEINLTLSGMNTATSNTNAATEAANTATENANAATNAANTAASAANVATEAANTAASTANVAAEAANTAASAANVAASAAYTAANTAYTAGKTADTAAITANTQAEHLQNMVVTSGVREYGSGNTASLTDDGTKKILTLGIERGAPGAKGDKGDKGDTGPAGVTFTLQGTVLYINLG